MCAAAAQVDVALLIDNSLVLNGLCDLLENRLSLPKFGFGRWTSLMPYLSGRNHSAHWVPSHDKKPNWKPSVESFGDAKTWRELNSAADTEADTGKKSMLTHYKHDQQQLLMDVAHEWADNTLANLWQHAADYIEADDVIKDTFSVHLEDNY